MFRPPTRSWDAENSHPLFDSACILAQLISAATECQIIKPQKHMTKAIRVKRAQLCARYTQYAKKDSDKARNSGKSVSPMLGSQWHSGARRGGHMEHEYAESLKAENTSQQFWPLERESSHKI